MKHTVTLKQSLCTLWKYAIWTPVLLVVQSRHTRLSIIADRPFPVADPRAWNADPLLSFLLFQLPFPRNLRKTKSAHVATPNVFTVHVVAHAQRPLTFWTQLLICT